MEGPSSPREHPSPHPAFIQWLSSPRRLAFAIVGALLAWTALLGVVAHLSGISSPPPQPAAAPRGLGTRRRLLRTASSAPADEEEDVRWADKLLGDLQSSSADESTSATIAELRATLAAREERRSTTAPPGVSGARSRVASAAAAAPATVNVPRYDPSSVAELQKAALAAALPAQASGPLPQLVRDMSAAMQRQQAEHEALQKRLAQLQPSVINYNPKDVDQLTKAVGEATGAQGAEVSGALPRLLRDLRDTLTAQQAEQKKLQRQLSAVASRKARSSKFASTLKDLVMKSSAMGASDKVTLLFGELGDKCTQAVEEARRAAELDAEGSSDSPSPLVEGDKSWRETHTQLQELVLEELRQANERNASLSAALSTEQARCAALDDTLKAMTTPPPAAPPPPTAASTSEGGATGSGTGAAATTEGLMTPSATATADASAITSVPADAPTDGSTTAAPAEASAPEAAPSAEAAAPATESPPPPPPATGACAGKRCPSGYEMIDRGDRCTCRPTSPVA